MPETTANLLCAKCRSPLHADERFCGSCGARADNAGDDAASPWALVIGQLQAATLGEFEVSRELGRGGMAAVYLAHEIALNRLVAIKVMAPGLFLGAGMVDRFRQEAVTVANLSHPNIITIHGVRQIDDLHFLVMKFVEGRSLESALHSAGPLPVSVIRAVLFQVGNGLAYAHRRGVIHRDIKPANILLDADGNAIVTDFGIAKLAEQKGQTQTGTMIGTPGYMSPEQCYGGQLTWSSDLYSLGIVAYELLTGSVPFTGTAFNVMQAHTMTPPPSIRERRADCPPDLEQAVLRLLAKTPEERFATMPEALAALGATPLAAGDPVREQLERLAVPDPSTRLDSTIRPAHSPIPRAGPRVGQLTISGAPDVVAAGDRFALNCVVRSDVGATLAGRAVLWSSSDDSVVAVTANGAAAARAPGRANVTATCEGVLASLPMTVLPAGAGKPVAKRSGALIGASVLAVLVIAAVGYAALHRSNAPSNPVAPGDTPTVAAGADQRSTDTVPHPAAPSIERTPVANAAAAPVTRKAGPPAVAAAHQPDSTPTPQGATIVTPAPPPPAPVAVAPAPPPPPAVVVPAGPTAAEIVRGGEAAVQAYVDGIRARSVDQMRRIYPGLSSPVAADWQTQFGMVGHDGVDKLDVSLANMKVTPVANGDGATAQFTVKLTLVQRRGTSQSSAILMRGTLRHENNAWHFDLLDQQRAAP